MNPRASSCVAPTDGDASRNAGDRSTQNFAGFNMNPLGSVAVLAPQDDEEVCRLRISGKVPRVCPCLCTQPVVVTCWDIPTPQRAHLIGCSHVGAMPTRGFARRKHYSPVATESKALRDLEEHLPDELDR